jgi:hypothetical protein
MMADSDDIKQAVRQAVNILDKKFGTHKALALHFGIDEGDFSRKYNGNLEWRLTEAAAILKEAGYSLVQADELAALRIFALKGLRGDK